MIRMSTKNFQKKRDCIEGKDSKEGFKVIIKYPFSHLWYLILSHLHYTF